MEARLQILEQKVRALYEERHVTRDSWADWLYETHVFEVARMARLYADRFGACSEISVAASMLHDCADAIMPRVDRNHTQVSNEIAERFLRECHFLEQEINTICTDILPSHGCKEGIIPVSLEGKVMATADAVVHLTTDFYAGSLVKYRAEGRNMAAHVLWRREKIRRDFIDKIFFDDVRDEVRAVYEALCAETEKIEAKEKGSLGS